MDLHAAALSFRGVPWRHRGRSQYGLDCIGLVVKSIEKCGGKLRDRRDYGREPWKDGLEKAMNEQLNRVSRKPEVNDILLMRWKPNKPPAHVAIVAPHPDGLGLVHTNGEYGEVVYTRLSERLQGLIVAVYRYG